MRKIITTHIYPPIPIRQFDWQAHFDGDEPNDNGSMLCGYGRTAPEAIADLISEVEAYGEHHVCKRCGEVVENGCEMDGCRDPDCPEQGQ